MLGPCVMCKLKYHVRRDIELPGGGYPIICLYTLHPRSVSGNSG